MKILAFLVGISVFGNLIPISVSQGENLDGKIICHPLICPETTYKCVVSERSVTSHHNIFKWSRCLDKNGQILLQDKRFIPSTFPGAPIDTLLEVTSYKYFLLF